MPDGTCATTQHLASLLELAPMQTQAFLYGVKTTRIFCLPSCPSKRPKAKNVIIFDNCHTALASGFRPCKRCEPLAPKVSRATSHVISAIDLIEAQLAAGRSPRDAVQAAQLAQGLSNRQLSRHFKSCVGITPLQLAKARKADQVRSRLQPLDPITTQAFDEGYESLSTFYRHTTSSLGLTPSQLAQKAPPGSVTYQLCETVLGLALVAATAKGICRVALGDDATRLVGELRIKFPDAQPCSNPTLDAAVEGVKRLALGHDAAEIPLDIVGTSFQQRVWAELGKIPPGQTRTYAEIASAIGSTARSARPVGTACAANELALIVPCHRVLRSDGGLGGYRWGPERKRAILNNEAKS